jgi:glycosyltransferase involved in cell wall biosynthesis
LSARAAPDPDRPLRIAQVAPPLEAVPPIGYGGTERIVGELVQELHRRGHEVTTFASGDSNVPGSHVTTVEKALRPHGFADDPAPHFRRTLDLVLAGQDEFDVIHAHVDPWNVELARTARIPVVSTFHGRLDMPWTRGVFDGSLRGMVAISQDQARVHPEARWTVIHHGVTFRPPPLRTVGGEDLCFVGRMSPEKGFPDAIEVARLTGRRLRVAAKTPGRQIEIDYHEAVIRPLLDQADVEILGELSEADRDQLVASCRASLVPSAWPEPFGLVVIEALACGTPVLGRRSGAIPEILRDGIDGFVGDDAQQLAFFEGRVDELDRGAIQAAALERFAVGRMVDGYEALYRRLLADDDRAATRRP